MEQKKDRRAVGVKILPEGVEEYCERHTTALTELHERLLKETEEKTTTADFLPKDRNLNTSCEKNNADWLPGGL